MGWWNGLATAVELMTDSNAKQSKNFFIIKLLSLVLSIPYNERGVTKVQKKFYMLNLFDHAGEGDASFFKYIAFLVKA